MTVATDTLEPDPFGVIISKLEKIQTTLAALTEQRMTKKFYTTAEVAKMMNKAEFTVREWARNHRIVATKRSCGRGPQKDWNISHDEVERIRNEGLLPPPPFHFP